MDFHKIYRPLTANPFRGDDVYMEYEPSEALKPFIRCFWGTSERLVFEKPAGAKKAACEEAIKNRIYEKTLVIPDTCMDIIFKVNHAENKIESTFCGIDDKSFWGEAVKEGAEVSTFAIRFYVWSTALFAEDSMKNVKNAAFDLEQFFSGLKKEIEPLLFEVTDMQGRIRMAEGFLQKYIHHRASHPVFLQATGEILARRGNVNLSYLTHETGMGSRQLERIFKEYSGLSPKRFSSLIRYQFLWKDILLQKHFDIQDAVFRYGFTDQAHLMHEFKRFHTMTVQKAKEYALKDVAFLQERV